MSLQSLSNRQRAHSTVSLRKRIVRANSEEKGSELKKSSTMTSFRPKLQRLIQQGKIQQILNAGVDSKANLFYTNHVNEMERELNSTKKSLSTLVIKSRTKQLSINSIKNEIRKVQREIDMIRQQAMMATKRFSGKNEDLAAKKQQQQIIFWDQKMNMHMRDRGYKDEVFLKGRYQRLKRDYQGQIQNVKLLQARSLQLKQLNKELVKMKQEANAIAKQQAEDKSHFISLVEADMSERDMLGQLKAQKHKREGEINEIASSLIEKEELERILQVLYAHRILSQIIKTKSINLLSTYEHINKAYNHIKSHSNIPEPDRILRRMQEHDKLYDDALKRVNSLEAELSTLQQSLQNCMISKNNILSKEGSTEKLEHGYYQGLQHDRYDLLCSEREKHQDRCIADEVLRKNIMQWGDRMFAHFKINQSENNSFIDRLTDLMVRLRQQH